MTYQLRIYRLKPATAEEFVRLWERDLVPLRASLGFVVVGAWRQPADNEFAWLLRWEGAGSFAEGEAEYYKARDQAGLTWKPQDYLESMQLHLLEGIQGHSP